MSERDAGHDARIGESQVREAKVRQAQGGDRAALADLIDGVQDSVYYLALRMLADRERAKDATQEILVRVVTKLSTFRGRSAFRTWVFRIAKNYLVDEHRRRDAEPAWTFDEFRDDLERDLRDPGDLATAPEYPLLLDEVRIGCTLAMLLCLDLDHRLAYILGDVFEMEHVEASQVLDVAPATYRKRLSRARARVVAFTRRACGLVSETAACSCDRKLPGAIDRGRVAPGRLRLAAAGGTSQEDVRRLLRETTEELRTLRLQRAVPRFGSPADFGGMIEDLLER